MQSNPSYLKTENGHELAYFQTHFEEAADKPGIIFLGGLMSDMTGTKAIALETFCHTHKLNYIRFDYVGHGMSSGAFTDGTIGLWKENVTAILDALTDTPQIIVGSSLGGWLMLHAALARPDKVAGLVGVASAPDFTENLMWQIFTQEQKDMITKEGIYQMPSDYNDTPYPITLALIEDGREHLLLNDPIDITCPVRLVHGMKDDDVPYAISIDLAKHLVSQDVCVRLVKQGDHRMSDDIAIQEVLAAVKEMLAICGVSL